MYGLIFTIVLSSFSSKSRIIKKAVHPAKNESKNINYSEEFYYPVLSFDKLEDKDNSSSFHFTGKKEIYPIRRGIVLFVGKEVNLPGYTVVLYHSPNYISFYSNLEEVKIIKGNLLKNIFEPIGITNRELIFSFRKNIREDITEKIDIRKFLRKRDNYNKT